MGPRLNCTPRYGPVRLEFPYSLRTGAMANLVATVSGRSKLKPRREPYWQRLKRGLYVGYRKMTADTAGTWVARVRLPNGKQAYEPLGPIEDVPGNERFDRAVDSANAWVAKIAGSTGSKDVVTVGDACDSYAQHVRETNGEEAAKDVEARYARWVKSHRIASIKLRDLERDDCREFRNSLVTAAVRRGGKTVELTQKTRAKSTVNRDLTPVRAALNFALAEGKVASDFAWRVAFKPFENAGTRRELYLDKAQRQALIDKADPDLAKFLTGLRAVPFRPGALAKLEVRYFEPRLGTLKVGKDKQGQDRKLTLGPLVAGIFCEECASKDPEQPIFTRSDGQPWNKDAWKKKIKAAAVAAGLPTQTTAYTIRHSVITDLVVGGLDLLTVAQISGTSVAMIEKHYGHLRSHVAAAALERLVGT